MTMLRAAGVADPPLPLLTVSGLSVSFGPVRALDDVSLSVRPGELIALAGENGAVLGGLIVGVIYNGLYLLGLSADAVNIWTALVLLAAVTVDTLARRGRTAS